MSVLDVKSYREENNLTQKDLGDMVGVTRRTIQNWEKGWPIPHSKISLLTELIASKEKISPTIRNEANKITSEQVERVYEELRFTSWTDFMRTTGVGNVIAKRTPREDGSYKVCFTTLDKEKISHALNVSMMFLDKKSNKMFIDNRRPKVTWATKQTPQSTEKQDENELIGLQGEIKSLADQIKRLSEQISILNCVVTRLGEKMGLEWK